MSGNGYISSLLIGFPSFAVSGKVDNGKAPKILFLQHPSIINYLNLLSLFTGTFCAATSCPFTSKGGLTSYLYSFLFLVVCLLYLKKYAENTISTTGTLKWMELASPFLFCFFVGGSGDWVYWLVTPAFNGVITSPCILFLCWKEVL